MRLRLYVASIALAAVVATSIMAVTAIAGPASIWPLLAVAALGLLAEVLTYRLPMGGSGSFAAVPFLAVVLLSPTWHAVAAVSVSMLAVQFLHRRGIDKLVFNVAQVALSTATAALAFQSVGGSAIPGSLATAFGSSAHLLLLALVPAIAFTVCNSITVAGVVSLASGQRWSAVWKGNTIGSLPYLFFAVPVSYVLAAVTAQYGIVGATLLSVPLLSMRQLEKSSRQLERLNEELLTLIVKAIEARDPYTSGHSQRVAQSVDILAEALRFPSRKRSAARTAALLHDVGKIHQEIGDILVKPGRLTPEERTIMESHSARGADLVATLSHFHSLVPAIRHHHERWDGTGYPDRVAGSDIPLWARLIALADTIDALATSRPYRGSNASDMIYAEVARCRGTQFDPVLCDLVLTPQVWTKLWSSVYQQTVAVPTLPTDAGAADPQEAPVPARLSGYYKGSAELAPPALR
ncbi:MAG TPA: HD-GYP domain-containing protein [Gemmatimonadales bacterium]